MLEILSLIAVSAISQARSASQEFNRAFPATFGRLVRVLHVSEPEEDEYLPGTWTKITLRITPDSYTWSGRTCQLWVDVATGTISLHPSCAVHEKEYHSEGIDVLFDIIGMPTTLVLHPLLWPVRRYYARQEERTGLDRNSRKLLEKLEGKVPADVHAALATAFRALRAKRLADEAAFRAQRAAEIAAATEEFRRTGKLSGT